MKKVLINLEIPQFSNSPIFKLTNFHPSADGQITSFSIYLFFKKKLSLSHAYSERIS